MSRPVADTPSLNAGGCEFQVVYDLSSMLYVVNFEIHTAALRADFRAGEHDLLVHLEFFLLDSLLSPEALSHCRRGTDIDLLPLVVGVRALVDIVQFRAEKFDCAKMPAGSCKLFRCGSNFWFAALRFA